MRTLGSVRGASGNGRPYRDPAIRAQLKGYPQKTEKDGLTRKPIFRYSAALSHEALSPPDIVIFSRPETFDLSGDMRRYLQTSNYVKVQHMLAIAIWRRHRKRPRLRPQRKS